MALPRPAVNLYPSVEWYFITGITGTDKLCTDADNNSGFTNILCETDNKTFSKTTPITCDTGVYTCSAGNCGELDPGLCAEPVSFYSAVDALDATCLINEGSTACEAMTSTDIARPDGSAKSDGTTRWYVGDDSYVIGTDYLCSPSDLIDDYINTLCTNDGLAVDGDIHIFCTKAEADSVEGMLKGTEKLTASSCSITSCTDMPIGMCDDPVDLYILDSGAVTYSDTCIKGDGSGTNCSSTTGTTPDPDESSESDDSSSDSSSDSSESSAKTATAVTFVTAIVAMFAL